MGIRQTRDAFTAFRALALEKIWLQRNPQPPRRPLCFSYRKVDDICAEHWADGKHVDECVEELDMYFTSVGE
jgi:hypothetical protein